MLMNFINNLDNKYKDNGVWQFIKFNIVSFTITLVQLLLANILPLLFDDLTIKLPVFLQGIFDSKTLFNGDSKYVIDGVVTWGYVLPFFLSNLIANIYGYFVNMKATFKGKGNKTSLLIYFVVIIVLILFTTWLQGIVVGALANGSFASLSRTIAALLAGIVQTLIIFPLEKYVLFAK